MQLPILSQGDRGTYVIKLQQQLQNWGVNCGVPDGVFGDLTDQGVKNFQAKRQTVSFARRSLAVDGVVGAETWAELLKLPVDQINILKVVPIVSLSQIYHIAGRSPSVYQLNDINACLNRFDITTPQRIRHFLAQICHESGGLQWVRELATGDAYEGRRDLGNLQPGDGRKFKGAGYIQLTGRANYQAFAGFMGDSKIVEIGCDYVAEHYPATSAGYWWRLNNMNAVCDRPGITVADITRRVNGGLNGLSDRVFYYNKACQVIA